MSEAVAVWPECGASIVRGVAHHNDLDLLRAFQQQPEVARYFICLFCRYCTWVDGIIAEQVSPQQWAACREQVWLRLYPRLQRLDANSLSSGGGGEADPVLKLWLAEQTRELAQSFVGLTLEEAPEQIQPYLSPALACYLTTGLETLPGDMRFILLLRDRFGWSPARIATQLKADGYYLAPEEVDAIVVSARQILFQYLPADVRALYLTAKP
ncbi:hypothetical protein L1047_05555 [Synechococcus sp. Nb3U1]|uniref:hypothetical protein n=1 Tax=Synechococcus sp. Nb3U1 TaxID=1914529 RepID=UPI001F1D3361|nr:hypothetical protein [Synechococcus sp. Nb3U1]MCF2970661.1 hypothetical protein [Synechococcus sp. Nb3U1]